MSLTGFIKVCTKSNGGILTIGLIEKSAFVGATLDATSDNYSAITVAASKKFLKYEFQEDEAEFKEDSKFENNSAAVTKYVIFKIPNMNAESRKAVQEIIDASYCGMIAIVTTPSGETFLVGYGEDVKAERPLRLSQSSGTTGKKMTDARGEEVTLSCEHTEKSRLFTGETAPLYEGTAA